MVVPGKGLIPKSDLACWVLEPSRSSPDPLEVWLVQLDTGTGVFEEQRQDHGITMIEITTGFHCCCNSHP
jgi:hypothetical protein